MHTAIDYLIIPNAGLVLLAPWLPRLFGMLGLFNEDGRDFKDTQSHIRAVFISQWLVVSKPDREYREAELAFNRILVGCHFRIPMPRKMELTQKETETANQMLEGVKANWPKMYNTSIPGFQHSFIERTGRIEKQKDKWVVSVDERSYDILLDSLPWSYTMIRFPWLSKHINVLWRNKE